MATAYKGLHPDSLADQLGYVPLEVGGDYELTRPVAAAREPVGVGWFIRKFWRRGETCRVIELEFETAAASTAGGHTVWLDRFRVVRELSDGEVAEIRAVWLPSQT